MAQIDDRKKRIMEHLSRSAGTFSQPQSASSLERKQRILDHVRLSSGQN